MRDRGREDDDLSKFLSRMGAEVSILGSSPESFESESDWAEGTLDSISDSEKVLQTDDGDYRVYVMEGSVIAASDDFKEIKAFESPKVSVGNNFDYHDYRVSMVSDILFDYIDSSHEGIEEIDSWNGLSGSELVDAVENFVDMYM